MGRRPKSEALKRAQGNPGKRKLPAMPAGEDAGAAPAVESAGSAAEANAVRGPALKAAPAWLSADGKKIWARIGLELASVPYVRAQDADALARYCEHMAQWVALTRALRKSGTTYWTDTNHGKMQRINPRFIARDRIEARLESLEDRFGFTPLARQRIMAALASGAGSPGRDLFDNADESEHPAAGDAPPSPEGITSPVGFLN